MNLQQQDQFYQWMTRLRTNSRAASTTTKDDVRITEMINGQLISKPAKKIEEVTEAKTTTTINEPKVWNLTKNGPILQQESKAASVQGINKLKEIHDFIKRGY